LVDGKISNLLKEPLEKYLAIIERSSSSRPRAVQQQSTEIIFQNTWESIDLHISVENIEVISEKESFIENAILLLSGHFCNINRSSVCCIFDSSDVLDNFQQPIENFQSLLILSFKNIRISHHSGSSQLHGIILQPQPNSVENYERVGYFWTADLAVVGETLKDLGIRQSVRLV